MDRFDLLGPLPRDGSTTVLEASAAPVRRLPGRAGHPLSRRDRHHARRNAADHVQSQRKRELRERFAADRRSRGGVGGSHAGRRRLLGQLTRDDGDERLVAGRGCVTRWPTSMRRPS
ncbi:exodeoxyribonuclease V beta chain domain protein, partial [Mycobacterium xenopi 4042]